MRPGLMLSVAAHVCINAKDVYVLLACQGNLREAAEDDIDPGVVQASVAKFASLLAQLSAHGAGFCGSQP